MKRILIVSTCPTHPMTAGNRKGILNQVETLKCMGHDVYFYYIDIRPLSKLTTNDSRNLELSNYWGDHLYIWKMPILVHLFQMILQKIRFVLNQGYINVDDLYPHAISRQIKKIHKQKQFDCCIINYYYLSKLFTKVTFDIAALFTHDYFAYKKILVGSKSVGLNTTAHEEAIALQRSPNIFSVNTDESIYFSKLSPRSRIFNIFSHYEYIHTEYVGNTKILFFSGNNEYNINGLRWFITNVFPLLEKRIPEIELIVGGSICKNIDISDEKIKLVGFVEDPIDFYSLGDIVINPTYEGTGLKIKTFEAISYDKIIIAHPHSIEGIYRPDTAPVLVAREASEWLACIQNTMQNKEFINAQKRRNMTYLQDMNRFVESEYIRLLKN